MSTDTLHELQDLAQKLSLGLRDAEVASKARERMDREREELRERIGTVEVAVDLVRDARNP